MAQARVRNNSDSSKQMEFELKEYNVDTFKTHYKDNVHKQVRCNLCSAHPIQGLRFKCWICKNFDLCMPCFLETTNNNNAPSAAHKHHHQQQQPWLPHLATHPMMVITDSHGSDIKQWIGFTTDEETNYNESSPRKVERI